MRRTLLLTAVCATALTVASLRGQDPKPAAPAQQPGAPAQPAAPGANGKRTPEQVEADLRATGEELKKVLGDPEVMLDAAQRKAAAPKAIPIMKRMVAGFDEMVAIQPEAKAEINDARMEFTTILSLFGDADSTAALERLAKGQGTEAIEAKCGQQVVAFLTNTKDEAGQLKVVEEMSRLAKANPKEAVIGQTLLKMANMGAASKAVSERAEDVIVKDLSGPFAQQVGDQIKAARKLRDSVNKPVEIAGTKLDGGAFNTKDWRGKVVLVDFWATWCPPCIEGLPKVKKAYLDHHAKGLEIVGVSCDAEVAQLKAFLERNKDMPWPQLVDSKIDPENPFHTLAKQWGIRGIPTMFLIDRKGVLRSTAAEQDFEEMIPKLLAEKPE